MNEQDYSAPSRSAVAAQFFNSFHRYKNVLLSKWWVLFVCVCMGVAAPLCLKWNAVQEYMSTGRMILSAKAALPGNTSATEEMNNFYGTQIALMKSDVVSNMARVSVLATNTTVEPCPVSINVTVSPKTSIFNVEATGTNGLFTQYYLDALMDSYTQVKKEMRSRIAVGSKEALQTEIEKLRDQIQSNKQAQLTYESNNSVVFLQDQGNVAADYLNKLTQQQASLKSERDMLRVLSLDESVERQAMNLRRADNTQTSVAPATSEMERNSQAGVANDTESKNTSMDSQMVSSQSEYLKAKQQIELLKRERAEWSEFLKPKHPKIVAIDEELARKNKLLEVFQVQIKEQIDNFRHTLELQIANLDDQIKEWGGKSLEISRKMSEYQTMKEDKARLQNMFDRLMTTYLSIDMDRNVTQESVTVLEPATPPSPAPSRLIKFVVLAAGMGLILGLSILVVLDRLDDRPSSFSELQELVNEEVLGQIPMVRSKDKASPGILREDDDRHALVEAYRNLRSSIAFLGTPENHPKTVLVTSAIPSDGKSMTSSNLAITLARSGARVLLVDADLRRGVMHTNFNTRNSPGFSEVLAEQAPWKDAVVATETPNLWLLPRGSTKRHPGELFVSAIKDKVIKEITQSYDYVLFDTAPVMAADDVSNLAPYVDGVIMVIRANFTSGRVARAALDQLYQRKTKILGVVFNAVRARASEYYYYHYKDYYAKHSSK